MVIGTWLFAPLIIFLSFIQGCGVQLFEEKLIFKLHCSSVNKNLSVSSFVLYFGVYLVGVLYLAAIRRLGLESKKVISTEIAAKMSKRNVSIFRQAFSVWFALLVNALGNELKKFIYHNSNNYFNNKKTQKKIIQVIMMIFTLFLSCNIF